MSSTAPGDVLLREASGLRGTFRVPGDKSISHRAALLAAMASGTTEISGFVENLDCRATLDCVSRLGAVVAGSCESLRITGFGEDGPHTPAEPLDARNSGTTIRLLTGALAGADVRATITGDASLSRRPMERVAAPLRQMGAIVSTNDGYPPLTVQGSRALEPIDFTPEAPSAQVKSAVMLAGLSANGRTFVRERVRTRDHTERMLQQFGAECGTDEDGSWVVGPRMLRATAIDIPGDFSSAAFLIALGVLVPGSEITIERIGLNPTRIRMLDVLSDAGADIEIIERGSAVEPTGDIRVRYREGLRSNRGGRLVLSPQVVAELIDEVPVLAIIGTRIEGGIRFEGAADLRRKESDRLAAVHEGLERMGASVRVLGDSLEVDGPERLHGARIRTFDDHRIAMAFSCAAMIARGETVIENPNVAAVSFPEFFNALPPDSVAWTVHVSR